MMVDRRVANAMNPDTAMIHARLEAWSSWAAEHLASWPEQTLLSRVIQQGVQGACVSRGLTEMPDGVAITDRAICRLQSPDRVVICEYYLRWEPAEYVALRLNLTERQLKDRLKVARVRVGAYVEILEQKFVDVC
jgi:hypothetical protein